MVGFVIVHEWATAQAEEVLGVESPRWRHCRAVADRARDLDAAVAHGDREALLAAAYLHDIGYAAGISTTGFHPLDGARYLRALGHERLAGLVAYHSAAREEAALHGLSDELAEFDDERSAVSDALTYADLTTGVDGRVCSLEERVLEIRDRYGPVAPVSRALVSAFGELLAAADRVEARLEAARSAASR